MPKGPVQQRNPNDTNTGAVYPQSSNVETLSGDKTVANNDEQVQVLDPNGSARNVDLPADEQGLVYEVVNTASAANDLTVRDTDGNTIHAVSQDESAKFYNHGGGYVVLGGAAASGGQDV